MNNRIYTSTPVNKLAKLVTQNQPNDEVSGGNFTRQCYMTLIKPPILNFHNEKQWLNLTGLTFGKLTVIGLFIRQNPKKKLKWVVQCKCGYYTTRTSQTIRRKIRNNDYDECHRCQHISRLKQRNEYHLLTPDITNINPLP